jgi:hypothetical protein
MIFCVFSGTGTLTTVALLFRHIGGIKELLLGKGVYSCREVRMDGMLRYRNSVVALAFKRGDGRRGAINTH